MKTTFIPSSLLLMGFLVSCGSKPFCHKWQKDKKPWEENIGSPKTSILVLNTREISSKQKTVDKEQVAIAASVNSFKNHPWMRVVGTHDFEKDLSKSGEFKHDTEIEWRPKKIVESALGAERQHMVVFVHGYNTSVKGSLSRSVELADALHTANVKRDTKPWRVAAFQWPAEAKGNLETAWRGLLNLLHLSDGIMAHYGHDNLQVDAAAYDLAVFLSELSRYNHSDKETPNIHIVAHSMGSQVVLKALALNAAYTEKKKASNSKLKLTDDSVDPQKGVDSEFNYSPYKIDKVVFVAPDVTVRKLKILAPLALQSAQTLVFYANTDDYILKTSQGINKSPVAGAEEKQKIVKACIGMIRQGTETIEKRIIVEDVTDALVEEVRGIIGFADRHYPLNSKTVRNKVVAELIQTEP